MSAVEDLVESVRAQISARLANPMIGSFVLAWCAWNYRFLVILFSNNTVTKTFELINEIAFPSCWVVLLKGLILPAVSAAIYIFGAPYPSRFVYEFTLKQQRDLNAVRQIIEKETLLSSEEGASLKAKAQEQVRLARRERDAANEEADSLRQLVRDLEKRVKLLDSSQEQAAQTLNGGTPEPDKAYLLSPGQLALVEAIGKNGGWLKDSAARVFSDKGPVQSSYDIDELLLQRFIVSERNEHGEIGWGLTQSGRAIYLNGEAQRFFSEA